MSFNQNFPFNYKPTDLTVTNGNYTVEATEYAYLTVQCFPGQEMFIDGTRALFCAGAEATTGWSEVALNNGNQFVIPDGLRITYIHTSGAVNLDMTDSNGLTLATLDQVGTSLGSDLYSINPGWAGRIRATANLGNVQFLTDGTSEMNNGITASFWLPPNTAVTGEGYKTFSRYLLP